MAFEEALSTRTLEAAGDLSASDGCAVATNADGRVVLAGADAADVFGVLRNKPAGLGHAATVIRAGTANMQAGGAIAKGDRVSTDASGRATTGGANEFGTALTATTAAGQRVAVELDLTV